MNRILGVTRRCLLVGTATLAVNACASGGAMNPIEPVASGRLVARPAAAVVPAEDSAADLAALEALRDLEYQSVAKGANHVRGTLSAADLATAADAHRVGTSSRGGAASVAGPTYDLDVESFVEHERVAYFMDFFLNDSRDRFAIWLGRLNRYEGLIRARFQAHGLPGDMVYLGMIESGYSNTAVSRANAVGMWQFMSYTAPRYGLVLDDWVDERRDPFKATDAAAQYLAEAKDRFGSWYLAAAAYNGGPNRVSRGLRRLGETAATDETFFELSDRRWLRRETRDYVPKLIAATLIAKAPLRYGFDSIPYLQPLVFDEITVPDATGLDVLAELADTNVRALVELNPHYYRGVTPPGRRSIVRMPRGTGQIALQRYAALPLEDRVNFLQHKIRRGETLGEVGKRYGVSVQLLIAANPGIQPRRLRIDQRVVIPNSAAARANPGRAPRVLRSGTRYHQVRWGESLWLIARRYGVTVRDLQRWNGIRNQDVLKAGTRLLVAP
jgi:membrane-bound lytic murein transglycosylase D